MFSTYKVNKILKLSFTLNCVLKRANDLRWLETVSSTFQDLEFDESL